MAKIKITCPQCGQPLQCDESFRGKTIRCPPCKHLMVVPEETANRQQSPNHRSAIKKLLLAALALIALVAMVTVMLLFLSPVRVHWPDRRPIGVLFLASGYHSSPTNPRGWFNDPKLDVTGTNGPVIFRKALLEYADRSIAILKKEGAQGAIVWDVEGEEYPHKTTYIGDPRLLKRLAPEMAAVADEFFGRLRNAGLRVGLTIRPQHLVFDEFGQPRQTQVFNTRRELLEKIDYARERWGASMFFIDSNGGIRRPDEVWQLRQLAKQRPDVLLIPEHHYLPYWAFSAPYVRVHKGDSQRTANWARRLFSGSFQLLDLGETDTDGTKVAAVWRNGDVLLFRAWFDSEELKLLNVFTNTP